MTGPDPMPTDKPDDETRVAPRRRGIRFRRVEHYLRARHFWGSGYRMLSYLKSALWTVPLVSIVIVLAMMPLILLVDGWFPWRFYSIGLQGAKSLYQTVITLTLSFVVFTFGSLLVAIQVTGGQLTPRVIATALLRDNVVRYSVGFFVFTLMFAVIALDRTESEVYQLIPLLTGILGIASLATFLFLIDYAARLLRPVSIVARIGEEGLEVLRAVYPDRLDTPTDEPLSLPATLPDGAPRRVDHVGPSEVVVAVDVETLIAAARESRGIIEFVPQVGDFLATDEPLFMLYGGACALDDRLLRDTVSTGSERTMEQDPLFAFRILVDIALKALSPAINDPTTAVIALDQIHRLLRYAGRRRLQGNAFGDASGHTCLLFRTPNWVHFVQVACIEIRACGANNVQVARRLAAMLSDLAATLPECRREVLHAELERLQRMLPGLYALPEDLALARIPDLQGLGGSPGRTAFADTPPGRFPGNAGPRP